MSGRRSPATLRRAEDLGVRVCRQGVKDKLAALGHGLKAAAAVFVTPQSSRYQAAGFTVKCPHCQGVEFEGSKVLLNTTGMTFIGLDWLNSEAFVLKCLHCSRLQWFADELDTEE